MTIDALERLRAADPCPAPVAYDDTVAQRNIETIVRTDLTVGGPSFAFRSSPRPSRLAVAAVTVGLVAIGSVVGVAIAHSGIDPSGADGPNLPGPAASSPSMWTTFSANGITFDHPTEWTSYPPGFPSTMSFTLAYLSTAPYPPVCTTTTTGTGEMTSCHNPEPDLSGGGVFVDWTYVTSPGGLSLDRFPGSDTTIAGIDARLDRSTLPTECGPTHAVAGVGAALATASNNVLTMTACVGPGDVDADLAAVDRMLASLRIDP